MKNSDLKEIHDALEIERMRKIIRDTSIVSWNRKIQDQDVDEWLSNFKGDCLGDIEAEQKIALWLLANFTYYTVDDMRTLCKELFYQYIHEVLSYEENMQGDLNKVIESILRDTVFLGLGNSSESSGNILYLFRQCNALPRHCFDLSKKAKYLVYVDDASFSGDQATEYLKKKAVGSEQEYIASLFISNKAIHKIDDMRRNIKVISAMKLDERDLAFSEHAHLFSNKKIAPLRKCIKEFCEFYGKIAIDGYEYMKEYPLGYKNGQYLMGFEYNTPNNTLPIFWGEANGWKPIFRRFEKNYLKEKGDFDEGRYY